MRLVPAGTRWCWTWLPTTALPNRCTRSRIGRNLPPVARARRLPAHDASARIAAVRRACEEESGYP